jgi:cell division transport system ATP-binding protein
LADLPDSPWLLDLDRVEVQRGTFRLVLSELSLQVARGELVFISGPSGSGKSTLLRLMAGIEQPTSGRITIAGQDVARLGPRARAHLRRQMGIVPQETELFDDCSVIDNVCAPALIAGERRPDALERARVALDRVGLDGGRIADLRCDQLSSGERRRVVLARALASRPALLLIDEPPRLDPAPAPGNGAGVDLDVELAVAPAGSDRLFELLAQFCRSSVTAIVVMREAVPAGYSARRFSMAEGRLST